MKSLRIIFTLSIIAGVVLSTAAQVQTAKGQVTDKQSEVPLTGATVIWLDAEETIGSTTDLGGYFKLEGVGLRDARFNHISVFLHDRVCSLPTRAENWIGIERRRSQRHGTYRCIESS